MGSRVYSKWLTEAQSWGGSSFGGQGRASMLAPLTLWFCIFPSLLSPAGTQVPVWETEPGGTGNEEGTELPDKERGQQWASGLAWIFFFFLLFLHPASVKLKKTEL